MCFKAIRRLFGSRDENEGSGDSQSNGGTIERLSPQNIIPRGNILLNGDHVEIKLTGLAIPFTKVPEHWVPSVPDTNSMDPVFDSPNRVLYLKPADEENQRILCDFLQPGDIAVYQGWPNPLVHRIVSISHDEEGRRFHFKGDNNQAEDPFVVRDAHIQAVAAGIIY